MYSKNNFLTTCKHRQAIFRRFLVICWFRQLFLFFAQFSSSSVIPNRIQYCSCTRQLFTIYKKFSFLVAPVENFWEQLNIGKVRPVFRTECSKNSCSISQKLCFIPVSAENWFVQMINPIPVPNSSYHLPKPCNDRFACVNGKQPVYLDFSSFWSPSKRAIGTLLSTDFMINFLSELTNIRWEIENRIFVGKTSTISFCIKD